MSLLYCYIDLSVMLAKVFLFSSDVVTIEKTAENFRILYDIKGRFDVHRIKAEEAKVGAHCR